jgi:hypothetical protein
MLVHARSEHQRRTPDTWLLIVHTSKTQSAAAASSKHLLAFSKNIAWFAHEHLQVACSGCEHAHQRAAGSSCVLLVPASSDMICHTHLCEEACSKCCVSCRLMNSCERVLRLAALGGSCRCFLAMQQQTRAIAFLHSPAYDALTSRSSHERRGQGCWQVLERQVLRHLAILQ